MASNSNLPQSHSPAKKEKTFDDILQTISRGKKVLVISFITIMAAVFLFNTFVKPKYDSAVILKKEKVKDRSLQDQLQDMVQMQSLDEIETEIEIVTTKDVITRVVDELSLNVNINKVISNGNITDINKSIIDYNHDILSNPFYAKRYPRFSGIRSDHLGRKGSFYIQKNGGYNYQLFNSQDNTIIAESKEQLKPVMQKDSDFIDSLLYPGGLGTENEKTALRNLISFEIPQAVLDIEWPDSKPGDKFYFDLKDYSETVDELTKEISVKRKAKTDLFEIRVISSSPYSAKIMANTVADKFREVRLDHQRQTIRGSFNFVDKQIKEMFEKLNKADAELTRYKTQGKITSIDDNSKNLINFLGNLEAEKVKTELELSDYQNKYQSMKGELSKNGYFDQTFLTPEKTDQAYSPFSNLQRQLSDLELQRIQLLQKRKETHPDVIMIDNQIKQVKEKMGNYNQNTLTAYQIIINTAQKKRQELMDLSEKYNSKIKELPGQESRLAELTRNKNVYERIFVLLLDKREEMRMAEVSRLQDIVMVESAVTNTVPVFPDKRMNYLAGLLLSLVMGLFVIFLIEFIRRKKMDLDDIENDLPFPLIALIQKYPKEVVRKIKAAKSLTDHFVILRSEMDGFREAYRVLRTKLYHILNNESKVLMITSCEEGTGKTTVAANLAISMAMSGKKVLLIDCDLKRATLSKRFDISENYNGLTDYLKDGSAFPNVYYPTLYNGDNKNCIKTLHIIPSGPVSETSSELLGSTKMKGFYDMMQSYIYDYIILDTPPVTRVIDALIVGKIVKNALLVIKPGYTYKEAIKWGIDEMQQAGVKILGTVANSCVIEKSSFRHKFGYGYGYSYAERKQKTEQEKEKIISRM